mmetsp:Transcript_10462/g.28670  ORF Transcript_10462/g.28670 Transcript_10462/m.28670 type:complete len:200 (-) Transcript_10462:1107-1706(-)
MFGFVAEAWALGVACVLSATYQHVGGRVLTSSIVRKNGLPVQIAFLVRRVRPALHQILQAKSIPQIWSHVIDLRELLQEGQQSQELGVVLVVIPGLDGDAVLQLETERLRRVVHNYRVCQVSTQHRQVFQVISLPNNARVPVNPVTDVLSVGVNNIEQLLGIYLLRRGEDHNLKMPRHALQEGMQVGPLSNRHHVRDAP